MAEAEPESATGTRSVSGSEPETEVPAPSATPAAEPAPPPSPSAAGRAPSVAGSLTLVAVGGCAGTLVRAALERAWPAAPGHLPTTTLAINVVGALALGLLLGSLGEQRPRLRLVLGTGVLGALTTHSTFILESHRILASGEAGGHPALGAAYLLGSMAIGLVAAGLGLWSAGRVGRRGRQGGPSLGEAS